MIVAYDKRRAIGKNGGRPWDGGKLKADMRRFRELSKGKSLIMGQRTFLLDVGGRALPNRQNIVLSREDLTIPGVAVAHSLAEAYALAEYDIAVIGGGQVFHEALGDVDTIYATEFDGDIKGDVFFPQLSENEWEEVERQNFKADEDNIYDYSFVTYRRKE